MTPSSAITDARVGLGRHEREVSYEVRYELLTEVNALHALRERIAGTCAKLDACESRAFALTAREVHATVSGAALQLWSLLRSIQ